MSSAAHTYFRRWRGSSGEPRTVPAREFDPGCRNDCWLKSPRSLRRCLSAPRLRLLFPRRPSRRRRARWPFWLSSIVWKGRSRFAPSIGRKRGSCSAMAAGCSQRMSLYPALASADQFIIGSVMGVTAVDSLRRADEPCLEDRSHPGGVRAHPLSAHVQPVRAMQLTRLERARSQRWPMALPPFVLRRVILSATFFRYWIGADFATVAAPVAQVLFPGMWMGALSLVGFTLLQSQGRADVTGKLNIVEFLPFVGHSLGLTMTFGIVGAAVAWSFALHGGCVGHALAFRNEKDGPSSFVASGRAFGRNSGYGSLPGPKRPRSSRPSRRSPRPRRSLSAVSSRRIGARSFWRR